MLFLYTNYLDVFEGINSTGIQTIELEVGKEYTFVSSVSGYSRNITINEDTTDVYVMPEGALYWYGNECTDKSGGWQEGYVYEYHGTLTKKQRSIYMYASSGQDIYCETVKLIDLSKYNKMLLTCNITSTGTKAGMHLFGNSSPKQSHANAVFSATNLIINTTTTRYEMDLSSYTQSLYLAICFGTSTSQSSYINGDFSGIWLE